MASTVNCEVFQAKLVLGPMFVVMCVLVLTLSFFPSMCQGGDKLQESTDVW